MDQWTLTWNKHLNMNSCHIIIEDSNVTSQKNMTMKVQRSRPPWLIPMFISQEPLQFYYLQSFMMSYDVVCTNNNKMHTKRRCCVVIMLWSWPSNIGFQPLFLHCCTICQCSLVWWTLFNSESLSLFWMLFLCPNKIMHKLTNNLINCDMFHQVISCHCLNFLERCCWHQITYGTVLNITKSSGSSDNSA